MNKNSTEQQELDGENDLEGEPEEEYQEESDNNSNF